MGEEIDREKMTAIRCPKCGRLLCKGKIIEIEIKCPKCGAIFTVDEGLAEIQKKGY